MDTLVVGAGALGGVITGRLLDAGVKVALAPRDRTSADRVLASGIHITGVGDDVMVDVNRVAPLSDYMGQSFDAPGFRAWPLDGNRFYQWLCCRTWEAERDER